MKICTYCDASNDDGASVCSNCGAREFEHVCENCETRFQSGYCPNCGVKAGEKPRVCPNCGEKSFGVYCPDCGQRLVPQARSFAETPVQDNPVRSTPSIVGMVVLTVLFPFVGVWVLLMDDRYGRSLKLFALIYCAVCTAALFLQRSWAAGLFCFAPIAGYGLKIAIGRIRNTGK